MRLLMALAALAVLAGCDASIETTHDQSGDTASGYTLEVRANEGEQIFLVTTPEGRTVGGRSAAGASALMDRTALRALGPAPAPSEPEDGDGQVSIRFPGFNMSVSGAEDADAGDHGRVAISVGAGEHSVEINADEGGPGDADDRAHVLIRGVSEEQARDFIAKADALSPQVQAAMLDELGLD